MRDEIASNVELSLDVLREQYAHLGGTAKARVLFGAARLPAWWMT